MSPSLNNVCLFVCSFLTQRVEAPGRGQTGVESDHQISRGQLWGEQKNSSSRETFINERTPQNQPPTHLTHVCPNCARVCKSRIGLCSHLRGCHRASNVSQWSSQAKKTPSVWMMFDIPSEVPSFIVFIATLYCCVLCDATRVAHCPLCISNISHQYALFRLQRHTILHLLTSRSKCYTNGRSLNQKRSFTTKYSPDNCTARQLQIKTGMQQETK